MAKLAFFTFGILREAQDHIEVQGFFDQADHNFEIAEQSSGFIARSGYDDEIGRNSWGGRVCSRFCREDDHGIVARTLSLWEDVESVFAFAYAGAHAEALRRRKHWFLVPEWPTYVAWWVADGHIPDWQEAAARHEHLHDYGSSPYAFDFKQPFGRDGKPVEINRAVVKIKIERNACESQSP